MLCCQPLKNPSRPGLAAYIQTHAHSMFLFDFCFGAAALAGSPGLRVSQSIVAS